MVTEFIFEKAYMSSLVNATAILGALAEPTRLRLLLLLDRGEVCVCFLQGVLRTNQPKISRHLALLRKVGVVKARRRGKWVYYRRSALSGAARPMVEAILNSVSKDKVADSDRKRLARLVRAPGRFRLTQPPAPCAC